MLKEKISDNDKELLKELPIYREIAIYNIYYRALNIIEQAKLGMTLDNKPKRLSIALPCGEKEISLFYFDTSSENHKEDNYLLGTINLYKRVYDVEKNKLLLGETETKLQELYNETNPYNDNAGVTNPMHIVYDGPETEWLFEHDEKVRHYKNILSKINGRKQLTEEEKRIIEATSTIHYLLLEEYGLKEEDLIDEDKKKLMEIKNIKDDSKRTYELLKYSMQHPISPYAREDEEVLTKQLSYATIKSNIRYII